MKHLRAGLTVPPKIQKLIRLPALISAILSWLAVCDSDPVDTRDECDPCEWLMNNRMNCSESKLEKATSAFALRATTRLNALPGG